jgi:predicted nucleotidyltransferase
MLTDRILATLKFFDLQNTPLTLSQLRDFLLNEPAVLKGVINNNFEIIEKIAIPATVSEQEIEEALKNNLSNLVERHHGHYCLLGRQQIVHDHFTNQKFWENREKLIKRFVPDLRFIPFVRGVAVGGSQSLGQSKEKSDIDLLVILDPKFLWLGRVFVTAYFQLTGHRRHGKKIANRFCLNHYLAGSIEVSEERDLYNAMEYLRLRPEVFPQATQQFVSNNLEWIRQFFPNANPKTFVAQKKPGLQQVFEVFFNNQLGTWVNKQLGQWQMKRILRGNPPVANQTELSFHSKERKFAFLAKFFEGQQ